MFLEYVILFKYLIICLGLIIVLFLVSFLGVFQKPEEDKYSPYECGFNPFADARVRFEIHFYLVGILFIIFDLEIVFLFPWVIIFWKLSLLSILAMLIFIIILTLGFAYEWAKQALDWD